MTHLHEGDTAPPFAAEDQNGKTVSLARLKGKKVVLYFYPQDDSPTCTKQACNLRDNIGSLKRKGFTVLGVSPEGQKSHKKFEQKFDLPFTLLVDEDKKIVNDYGVWGEKLFMGRTIISTHRTTFLIDGEGIIRKIIYPVHSGQHAEEILEAWKEVAS